MSDLNSQISDFEYHSSENESEDEIPTKEDLNFIDDDNSLHIINEDDFQYHSSEDEIEYSDVVSFSDKIIIEAEKCKHFYHHPFNKKDFEYDFSKLKNAVNDLRKFLNDEGNDHCDFKFANDVQDLLIICEDIIQKNTESNCKTIAQLEVICSWLNVLKQGGKG